MPPVLEDDPAFDREGGEKSPREDDTANDDAAAPVSDDGVGDPPPSVDQGSPLDEETEQQETSEQLPEEVPVLENAGGGKEIDESVAESIAQPQPGENAGESVSETESEEVEGPEVTSDRPSLISNKEPAIITSFFDRAKSLVASSQSNTPQRADTEEVVQSVVNAATPWVQTAVEKLQGFRQGVADTTDVAVKAACNQIGGLQESTTTNYYIAQDHFWRLKRDYKRYEDSVFDNIKDGVKKVVDRPGLAAAVGIGAIFVLFRRPRRLLFKHTLGRFRTEEAMLASAKRKVDDFRESVRLQLQDKGKLQERYNNAECEFLSGRSKLENTGGQIRSLVRNMYKSENQAEGLLETLRELPGKDALHMRAEVAALGGEVKKERASLDRKMYKIADYNIPV